MAVMMTLLAAGAMASAAAADLTGAEIPFHVLVESWLSTLEGIPSSERPDFIGAAGLSPEGAALTELPGLRAELIPLYAEMIRTGDPDANCWKVETMGRRLAEVHLSTHATTAETAPWANVLTLIDHQMRQGTRLVTDENRETAIERHRLLAGCWAEGVRTVYPDGEVAP